MADIKGTHAWKRIFLIFWVSQAFSLLGSSLMQFALVWWLTRTTGSASILAAASAIAILPEIFISPFAGVTIDRINRKTVMMVADAAIALATLLLAGIFYLGWIEIWHVYVLMFLRALGSAFHFPAEQASISLMVPEKHLSRIAGLNQALHGGINIIAPPLGALLLEILEVQGTLTVDFATAFLAILLLFFIHVPQPEQSMAKGRMTAQSLFADLRLGLRYILDWKGLVALIGIALVFKIALSPAFYLLPLFVNQHFHGDAAQYALVESIAGIGMVLGGLLLGIWGGFKHRIWTIGFAMCGLGLCFIAVSQLETNQFNIFLAIFFVLSMMIPMIDGPFLAILQAHIPPDYQGRVLTLTSSLLNLTTPIGLSVAGPLSDHIGIRFWYALAGVLCVLSMLAAVFIPQVRNIEKNHRI